MVGRSKSAIGNKHNFILGLMVVRCLLKISSQKKLLRITWLAK